MEPTRLFPIIVLLSLVTWAGYSAGVAIDAPRASAHR
jgi:hypothetical protein